MSSILKAGDEVRADLSEMTCVVQTQLGSGGQGEVYRATLGDTTLALKWYYPEWATDEQRAALEHLIRTGSPSPMFLWPVDLASQPGVPGYGYLMPLRAPRFRSGNDLMRRAVEPTFRALATGGYHLSQAFLPLHAKGLAYRDINFGNFFLDPTTGEVLICDLDNVGVNGQPHNQVGGVVEFMAPEVVRGVAMPSADTDLHSLAVLLFYLLFMSHPLEGKREADLTLLTPEIKAKLYGYDPLYAVHPTDNSNRPVKGRHDNLIGFWPVYPPFLKKLFERAFTAGLSDPAARVRESEWRAAMVQLRDAVVYCGRCKAENILPVRDGGQLSDRAASCWACQSPVRPPFHLRFASALLALNHDTQVYPHHVNPQSLYDFSAPVGEVNRHPTDASRWGLKNLSSRPWTATPADGTPVTVDPGRSVSLAAGTVIDFSTTTATIGYDQA